MKLVRSLHRWSCSRVPQRSTLAGVFFLGAIAGLPACAQTGSVAPLDEADNTGQIDESDATKQSGAAWRSRMRTAPIESLISSNVVKLSENSEVAFVGELIDRDLEDGQNTAVLKTRYEFSVEEYLKGQSSQESTIVITNLGGHDEVDGVTMSTPFSFEFSVGERYLVFLRHGYEKMTLPIIAAFAIHEDGQVLAESSGQQLVELSENGDLRFSKEAIYEPFNYAPRKAIASAAAPPDAPSPSAGQGDVEVNDTTANAKNVIGKSVTGGVTLADIADQINQ